MDRDAAKGWISETCGPGWLPLLDEVFDNLPAGVVILQVYQKWASLQFDFMPNDEAFSDFLWDVQERSERTCEVCGALGYHFVINHCEHTRCLLHSEGGVSLDAPA